MSINSGGNYHGYIGDICRMAIQGEPDAELEDILSEIETTQRATMKAIKPGAIGAEVYEAGLQVVNKSRYTNHIDFLVHGIGLVSHESPRLTNRTRDPYKPEDARCPLEVSHGAFGGDHAATSPTWLYQAGGHCGGDRDWTRSLWRPRAWLEPRRLQTVAGLSRELASSAVSALPIIACRSVKGTGPTRAGGVNAPVLRASTPHTE